MLDPLELRALEALVATPLDVVLLCAILSPGVFLKELSTYLILGRGAIRTLHLSDMPFRFRPLPDLHHGSPPRQIGQIEPHRRPQNWRLGLGFPDGGLTEQTFCSYFVLI